MGGTAVDARSVPEPTGQIFAGTEQVVDHQRVAVVNDDGVGTDVQGCGAGNRQGAGD